VIYFDASYLVRLYHQDPGADAVRALAATAYAAHTLGGNDGGVPSQAARTGHPTCRICRVAGPTTGHISRRELSGGSRRIATFPCASGTYQKLPAAVSLRATDAIHLATAAEGEFGIIYSNDARLLAAAKYLASKERM
jgi:predicted nucleic acid-binding protein